jgi:hypothetical protein
MHAVPLSEDEAHYRRLEELIQSHDVVYVLTDSREARYVYMPVYCFGLVL